MHVSLPLLLLPGLNCDEALWAPVVTELSSAADCQVPRYLRLNALGAMARDVLDRAPVRFALAGHSMGARVALEIARLAPERVDRLALLDTGYAARPDGAAGDNERRQRLGLVALARERGMRAMAREWVRGMVHPSRTADRALVEPIVDMIARFTCDAFEAQVAALLDRPDASEVLRELAVSTLIACGQEDGWAPVARHEAMAALVKASRLVVVAGAGHMAPMERPREVAAALADWLAEPSTGDRAARAAA